MTFDKELETIRKRAGVKEAMNMPITDPKAKQAVAGATQAIAYLAQHQDIPPVSMMSPEEKKALEMVHAWLQRALMGGGPGSAGY